MNIEKIKEKSIPIIEKEGLSLFSIKTKKEFGEHFVEILLDGENITSEVLEKIHLELYNKLTDQDIDPRYFLELSSVGIERPIDSKEALIKAIGKYIYVETPKYTGNGTCLDVKDDILLLEINQKGRIRKIEINIEHITFMRYAVKF